MRVTVSNALASPLRNLAAVAIFMASVMVVAALGYIAAGWSPLDAFYMVILTVYTVGYQEVRPVDTVQLRLLTIATIIFGCTGMIFLTGALVQLLTFGQLRDLLGINRVTSEIDRLKGHVIVCGFGRIGQLLTRDLSDAGAEFVVVERNESRIAQARALGYLCLQVDATDETGLLAAGVERARVLATVLPDDAANVFITLSARRLSADLQIIARGEQPSTESKLVYAGADRVVLPTHIGAERMAEMILYPETARFIRGSDRMRDFDKTLRDLGLELEVITVSPGAAAVGATVGDIEQRGAGAFFVVQLDRLDGDTLTRPGKTVAFRAGDGVLVVSRPGGAALAAVFQSPAARVRAGRNLF